MSSYVKRHLQDLADRALAVLESGEEAEGFPLIDGRVLAVQASPDLENSHDMAWGIAALPAGYSAPLHSHRAEEFAMILRGSGVITIDGEEIPVEEGDVVVTPPHLPHLTTAGPDGPMVVYWVYGPAGSEQRWLDRE
ncbi:MAG TPA: cupin domain-containing protein [Acidimicrobiia bacterium]|nr:cupin domain-containing protein [Acidimicrobiia bacterium]